MRSRLNGRAPNTVSLFASGLASPVGHSAADFGYRRRVTQDANLLFDITLTDEQAMMRDTVRKFTATQIRPHIRKADEAARAPDGFYAKSAELGFNMVQLADELGGMGAPRSPVSNMLLAEDLAHGDMALAIGALSSLSFINAVLDNGTDAQQKALLPAFASESFVAASVALMEPSTRFDPNKLKTRAQKTSDGYTLKGEKCLVPIADLADLMLVIADLDGVPSAFVVKKGAAGMSLVTEEFMGLRPLSLSRVTLDNVKVAANDKLGSDDKPFNLERLVDLARIGLGALTVGTGQAVLDYVTLYCNDRVAFGEPISHRQSVAFMIADIAIELDALRLLTYKAAGRAEQGLPFHREAFLVRVQAAEKGMKIGTDGVQLLGGHGFIREHPVELWYRNLRAIALLEGAVVI